MKSAGFFYNVQKENMLTIEKEDGRKAPWNQVALNFE